MNHHTSLAVDNNHLVIFLFKQIRMVVLLILEQFLVDTKVSGDTYPYYCV